MREENSVLDACEQPYLFGESFNCFQVLGVSVTSLPVGLSEVTKLSSCLGSAQLLDDCRGAGVGLSSLDGGGEVGSLGGGW